MKNISKEKTFKKLIVTDQNELRDISAPITDKDDVEGIVKKLKEANATAWIEGCGLAGIQIGVKKRIAWLETPAGKDIILVNPKIHKTWGNEVEQEGCLSIPNNYVNVMRPARIIVTFDTLRYKDKIHEVSGYTARVILHEIDHMDGILNIDKPYFAKSEVGRNQPCPECLKNGITIKYKKCEKHFQ